MLLDNPATSVWLTPCFNLMSTKLYLCKHKAHRNNLELCGDIVINNFRQLWFVIIVTGTPNMYRSKFFKASRNARHSFSTVEKCVSRANNIFAKYAIGCCRPNSFCWVGTAPQRIENSQPSKWMAHSNSVAAKWVNLSKPFEGHRMQQAQHRSFEIYQTYSF